ncbi:MAG: ATP-binding protein, partial [Candidatus Latescibacteria bacterium]|nr:ATP-binding protein [Candidatus Latescibacterota bacterium]
MAFVNRSDEISALRGWWEESGARLALVWGRRRVGKTALLQQFSRGLPAVFHTGTSRPAPDELRELSRVSAPVLRTGLRDLGARPFVDWQDAFETFADAARTAPLLLVLDEFPEILSTAPEVASILRAVWDRARARTNLRVVLCGSAVRTMDSVQAERAPLFGRVDLRLRLHPFEPHEAALMLPELSPPAKALVWGLVGGIPLYLDWWDQSATVRENLFRLVCRPDGRLLTEGEYLLSTEGGRGDLPLQVLHSISRGRTKFNEISKAVGTNPARVLDELIELRLIERLTPVTENPARTRRRLYRIADNFMAFWLSVVDRYRSEIDRGLGRTILPVVESELDDHMGMRWEEAFRAHLRRRAAEGRIHPEAVAVGPF